MPEQFKYSKKSGGRQVWILLGLIAVVVVLGVYVFRQGGEESPAPQVQNEQSGDAAAIAVADFAQAVDSKIVGIEPGAGIMINTEKAVEQYGLDEAGWSLQESSSAAMLAELQGAYENEEPFIVTVWEPHAAFSISDIRKLEDPKNIYNNPDMTREFLQEYAPEWADAEVASDVIATVVYEGFAEDAPAAHELCQNFSVPPSTQSDWIYRYSVEEVEAEQVASDYIESNSETIEEWLPADDTELGKSSLTIGIPPWPGATVKSRVLEQLLERAGYEVEVKEMDVGVVYTSLADQQLDINVAGWLPATHEPYWEKYSDDLEIAGINVAMTWLGLGVPNYIDESIQSLEDLAL